MRRKGFIEGIVLLIILAISLIVPTTLIVKSIQFNQECSGYLKQAADANTVELAIERIDHAIGYIEAHDLTSGYTSVLYNTEDENIGFWYNNIKACQKELKGCANGTQLEKSNVLMKVRESLTDEDKDGTVLTIPDGIYKYPHNLLWSILDFISLLVLIWMCLVFYVKITT